ncbi:hypothetical protein C1645_880159 [Glomus cerebriforme]|uniref:Uncharacterized protein n=1 Tax=Glomus cerebriforme TaxID=658196 RepID=A0A397SH58_9GLOM|nr:hypothetical protein C1645_880159 [Glomus cerebriforme]
MNWKQYVEPDYVLQKNILQDSTGRVDYAITGLEDDKLGINTSISFAQSEGRTLRWIIGMGVFIFIEVWYQTRNNGAFTKLITEVLHQLNGNIPIKGNDMELFHLLTDSILAFVKFGLQIFN